MTNRWMTCCLVVAALVVVSSVGRLIPTYAAEPQADFYQGKQIIVYIGYAPGGTYDLSARLLARNIGRFIPGHPQIVVENRPGAGSIQLANQMYTTMPRNGTAIGEIGDDLLLNQLLGEPGISFVGKQFNWIGRLIVTDGVFIVRPETGIRSIDDARKKAITIGIPGSGSLETLDISVLNTVLGTKFKKISGYTGSTAVNLAMERGEVDGSGSASWALNRAWVTSNHYRVLYQKAFKRNDGLENVPLWTELGHNDEQNELLRFFNSPLDVSRSFLAPPGVPAERVRILRTALTEMAKDPAVQAEAKKLKLILSPLSGEKLQTIVEKESNIPERLHEKALEISKAAYSGQ